MCISSLQSDYIQQAAMKAKGSETQFPGKLMDLLTYVEREGLEDIIGWVSHGRAFMVHDPDKLVLLLPMFFSQTKYRSFSRQCNMWYFERILDGPDKNAFHHPYFVKGKKDLCSKMSRHHKPGRKMYSESLKQAKVEQQKLREQQDQAQSFVVNIPAVAALDLDGDVSSNDVTQSQMLPPTPISSLQEERHREQQYHNGDLLSFCGRHFYYVDEHQKYERYKNSPSLRSQQEEGAQTQAPNKQLNLNKLPPSSGPGNHEKSITSQQTQSQLNLNLFPPPSTQQRREFKMSDFVS